MFFPKSLRISIFLPGNWLVVLDLVTNSFGVESLLNTLLLTEAIRSKKESYF